MDKKNIPDRTTLKQFLIEKGVWNMFLRNLKWDSYEQLDEHSFDDDMLEDGMDIHNPKEGSKEMWMELQHEWKLYMNNGLFDDPEAVAQRYGVNEDQQKNK